MVQWDNRSVAFIYAMCAAGAWRTYKHSLQFRADVWKNNFQSVLCQ